MLDWTGRYAFLNLFTTAARVLGVLCLSLLFDSVIQKGWKGMDWREVKSKLGFVTLNLERC